MAGVVRLDKVKSVYCGNIFDVVSSTDVLENGMYAFIDELDTNQKEVFKAKKPGAVNVANQKFVLIASPEISYNEYLKTDSALDKFSIPIGTVARAYSLEVGDIVSISKDLITQANNYQIGQFVVPVANQHKWEEKDRITDQTFAFKIIAKDTIGSGVVVGVTNADKLERKTELIVLQVVKA